MLKVGDKVIDGYGTTGTVVFISDDDKLDPSQRLLILRDFNGEKAWTYRDVDGKSLSTSTRDYDFKKVREYEKLTRYYLHYRTKWSVDVCTVVYGTEQDRLAASHRVHEVVALTQETLKIEVKESN